MLALAGTADFAAGEANFLSWIGIYVAGICAFIAVAKRSWLAAIVGTAAIVGVSVLFVPWKAFAARDIADLVEDPNELHWWNQSCEMAIAWMIVSAGVLMSLLLTTMSQLARASAHRATIKP
jgi:hypothetical protein